ncbi:2,3-diketo-5-methylthiopentyl-1-phosphate enolase [Dorcoceras hygrometricum]|uniref:2,3-diketo-5-methylthiopentyl-1-phosphate enolase n=1 Tax=Dorcoceras hygrometricum TaxID=472368 RepID=A0A2Z7DB15_9LAMI|nr:2,3-diketo-5-methylthiopentyl-1-phosphate enolase [Dorcoceras hygrometricum]
MAERIYALDQAASPRFLLLLDSAFRIPEYSHIECRLSEQVAGKIHNSGIRATVRGIAEYLFLGALPQSVGLWVLPLLCAKEDACSCCGLCAATRLFPSFLYCVQLKVEVGAACFSFCENLCGPIEAVMTPNGDPRLCRLSEQVDGKIHNNSNCSISKCAQPTEDDFWPIANSTVKQPPRY